MKTIRTFRNKPEKEYSEKTESQQHYEYMILFFKWALGFTGSLIIVILTAAGILFFKDRHDFNDDIKSYLKDSKEQINEMTSDAKVSLKETKEQSNLVTNGIILEAEKNLKYIRTDAKSLAIDESQKKVNEAFKDKNIQQTIEETARREIESRVNNMVVSKLSPISRIILAVDKIRVGNKKEFIDLKNLSKNSNDPFIRNMADSIINVKTIEYDETIRDVTILRDIQMNEYLIANLPLDFIANSYKTDKTDSTEAGCRKIFEDTKSDIFINTNLNYIALDFKILRFLTGKKIKMFDFDAAKNLEYKEGIPHPY